MILHSINTNFYPDCLFSGLGLSALSIFITEIQIFISLANLRKQDLYMAVQKKEKRKKFRKIIEESNSFVEIKHSFGSLKKSVYEVIEYDEYGLSFLIPFSEGYFMVDTPVKFCMVNNGLRDYKFGIVRYYLPFFSFTGKKYYKLVNSSGIDSHYITVGGFCIFGCQSIL